MSKHSKPRVVFVIGRAGAGKGTHCARLSKEYGHHHLNVGDILRTEKDNVENEDREVIASFMNAGNIVPAEVTCRLLERAMGKHVQNPTGKNQVFILDGFPRDMENIDAWNEKLADKYDLKFVLYLNCSEKICTERLLARGKTSGRADDNAESIRKRLPDYVKYTEPALEYFLKLGNVKEVDAEKSVDVVYSDVRKIVLELL